MLQMHIPDARAPTGRAAARAGSVTNINSLRSIAIECTGIMHLKMRVRRSVRLHVHAGPVRWGRVSRAAAERALDRRFGCYRVRRWFWWLWWGLTRAWLVRMPAGVLPRAIPRVTPTPPGLVLGVEGG